MKIVRRLDLTESNQERCNTEYNCPAVLELSSGDVAFIGIDVTDDLKKDLPPGTGMGPGERLVVVPRAVLASAGWKL